MFKKVAPYIGENKKYTIAAVILMSIGIIANDLGYDYYECGICKICKDEGCPELAKHLCKLDFMMADLMNAKLVRTKTLAEGADYCDFRYSLKR